MRSTTTAAAAAAELHQVIESEYQRARKHTAFAFEIKAEILATSIEKLGIYKHIRTKNNIKLLVVSSKPHLSSNVVYVTFGLIFYSKNGHILNFWQEV